MEPLLVLTLDCLARKFGYNSSFVRRLHARNTTDYAADCSSLVPNARYRCVALLGLVAGLARGKLARWPRLRLHHGHYFGLIGSYLGGWIFTKLGIFGGGFCTRWRPLRWERSILVGIAHAFSGSDR